MSRQVIPVLKTSLHCGMKRSEKKDKPEAWTGSPGTNYVFNTNTDGVNTGQVEC